MRPEREARSRDEPSSRMRGARGRAPTATRAARYATCSERQAERRRAEREAAARDRRRARAASRTRARASPCGSRVTGKNVPEKRNIGMIDEAEERVERLLLAPTRRAPRSAPANARPMQRRRAATRGSPSGECTAPNAAMTRDRSPRPTATRVATYSRWPTRRSRTRSGVASIAWYWRVHLIAPRTGKLDSNVAICIADRREHARRDEVEIRHAERVRAWFTSLPSPTPSARQVEHRVERCS